MSVKIRNAIAVKIGKNTRKMKLNHGPVLDKFSLSSIILFISYCKYKKLKTNVKNPDTFLVTPLFVSA